MEQGSLPSTGEEKETGGWEEGSLERLKKSKSEKDNNVSLFVPSHFCGFFSTKLSDSLLGVRAADSLEAETECGSSWPMKWLSREENEGKEN